jgi:hypothetical protein
VQPHRRRLDRLHVRGLSVNRPPRVQIFVSISDVHRGDSRSLPGTLHFLGGATSEMTCAPSAHPSGSFPLALVVVAPILECRAGPGAFIAETLRCPGQVKRLVCCALLAIALWLLLPVSAAYQTASPTPDF